MERFPILASLRRNGDFSESSFKNLVRHYGQPAETFFEANQGYDCIVSCGVLEHVLFKIKVRALPRGLPEVITVDVTPLEIGQSIHLGEIPLPPGVEVVGDKKIPVISVAAPITEAQETAALEGATTPLAEPEVLKEKKEEGAAETGAGAAAKPAEKGAEKAPEKPAEKAEKKPEKKK